MVDMAREPSKTLTAIKALTPEIARRSDEIEQRRGLPPDLLEKLRAAGLFRMQLPKRYGGDELHMLQTSRVLEELGKADGSAAWNGMIAVGWNRSISYFPASTLDTVFADSPDVYIRGAIAPKGTLVRTDGGYIVNGRWPLASGSYPQKYMVGNCLLTGSDGKPEIKNGRPTIRAALVTVDKVKMLDTWHSLGLRGSESHDFVIENQFVPEAHTANLFGTSSFDLKIFRLPVEMFSSPTHASVAIGIAQGALEDFSTLARSKRPAFGGGKRMAEDPILAHRFGELQVRLSALRAYTEEAIVKTWDLAHSGDAIEPAMRAESASMAAYVQQRAADIVTEIVEISGATPCYNDSVLQRRWRDIRCVCQHVAAGTGAYRLLGSALMGEDISQALL